jgi:uncharacterized delta-60 repeat protein
MVAAALRVIPCNTLEVRTQFMNVESLESRQFLSVAGDLDASFNYDGKATVNFGRSSGWATDVAVQSDGKTIVVGGTNIDKPTNFRKDFALARFKADGTLDPTFGAKHNGRVLTQLGDFAHAQAWAVAVQPDGKIVVAGEAEFDDLFAFHTEFVIARYMPDGTLDSSFDGDGMTHVRIGDSSFAHELAVQRDGKIVVVGYSNSTGSFSYDRNFAVARLNPDGSLDRSFASTGARSVAFGDNEEARAVAIDYTGTAASNPNYGKIVIAGTRDDNSTREYFDVVRLNANGAIDRSFGSGGERAHSFVNHHRSFIEGMMIQPNGKIVAVGAAIADGGAGSQFALARYNPDGNLDSTFGSAGNGMVETDLGGYDHAFDVIASANGGLIVGGTLDGRCALAGYNANGALNANFGDHGLVPVNDMSAGVLPVRLASARDRKFVLAGGRDFATERFFDVPLPRAGDIFTNVNITTVTFSPSPTFSGKLIQGLL